MPCHYVFFKLAKKKSNFLSVKSEAYYIVCTTVLPAKGDSDVMFCLQSYQGVIMDISLVY